MKSEELLRAFSEADDRFIEEAAEGNAVFAPSGAGEKSAAEGFAEVMPKKRRYNKLVSIAACAAVLIIGAGAAFRGGFMAGAPQSSESPAMLKNTESVKYDEAVPEEGKTDMKAATKEVPMAVAEEAAEVPMAEEERVEVPMAEEAEDEPMYQTVKGSGKENMNDEKNAPAEHKPFETAEGDAMQGVLTFTAEYPASVQYPSEPTDEELADPKFDYGEFYAEYDKELNLWASEKNGRKLSEGNKKAIGRFTEKTTAAFIGKKDGKNKLYSPVNAMLALNTLSQLTDGNTRAQLLALSGLENAENAERLTKNVITSTYCDDGRTKCLPASSLWIDRSLSVKQPILSKLCESQKLSSFVMDLKSQEASDSYRRWISEQTAGLLDSVVSTDEFSRSIAVLAETLYYKASWAEQFKSYAAEEGVFRASGADEKAAFMRRTDNLRYIKGKDYSACGLPLVNGDIMWFILTDDEKAPAESLAENGALAEVVTSSGSSTARVALKVPKFDVSSEMSLVEGLMGLGVTDAFCDLADFSPLTDTNICVSEILHTVRVKTDESGVEAAAITQIFAKATAMPREEDPIEFVCDRPFAFAIVSAEGAPLFAGIVNHVE